MTYLNNIVMIILGIFIGYIYALEYAIKCKKNDLLDEINNLTQSPLI